jgi:hypothetical protein
MVQGKEATEEKHAGRPDNHSHGKSVQNCWVLGWDIYISSWLIHQKAFGTVRATKVQAWSIMTIVSLLAP